MQGGGVGGDPSELRFHPLPPPAQELFSRLRPFECLGSVWSQRDRPGAASIAPTVRATVTQFNTVTGCVLGSVLGEPGLAAPQRAQRLEKWIRIAQVRLWRERGGKTCAKPRLSERGWGRAEGQGPVSGKAEG